MTYRHRGGPCHGLISSGLHPDYRAVAAPRELSGMRPGVEQDALYVHAGVISATFRHDGRSFRASVGEPIRALDDDAPVPGRQKVIGIDAAGFISLDSRGEWGIGALPMIQVAEMTVVDFVDGAH